MADPASPEQELFQAAQARLGRVLKGKYRLDRVLGVGGMASVYAATHRNQAEFAIKILHPELSLREQLRARFLREGYAANTVKHPGAVAVLDDDVSEDGAAFIVMELLHGVTVDALCELQGSRLPTFASLAIIHQLLDVLAAAHPKGIVHRDIKPANLFVTDGGVLKVLDFGIARLRDAAGGATTGTGVMLGTPAFMPPEQALAKAAEIDAQSDLWAVGATLFTMLSGQLVHSGDNGPQLLVQAATAQARSISSASGAVPPAVARLVDRALAFNKADRWPSASAMQSAVREVLVAEFAMEPDRATLAALVAAVQGSDVMAASQAATLPSDSAPAVGRLPPAPPSSGSITAAPRSAGVRIIGPGARAPDPRFETGHPVSSERGRPAPARSRVAVVAGVGVVAVVAAVLGTAALMRPRDVDSATRLSPPVSAALRPPPLPVESLVPPPAEVAPPAPSVPPPPTASAASGPTYVSPPVQPGARPAGPARPTPSAKPGCDPSYFFDAEGNKHFKPQCFGP